MKTITRQGLLKVLTFFAAMFASAQICIPIMPLEDPAHVKWVSAGILFAVSALTLWKQYLSNLISNAATTASWILVTIATLGLANEFLDTVEISNSLGKWLRLLLTLVQVGLNFASKELWPSDEQKQIMKDEKLPEQE